MQRRKGSRARKALLPVFFMIEYKEKKKRFFYLGVELADCFITYPYSEGFSEFNEFYESISQNAFEWFCTQLCEMSTAEYETDTDEKKRFTKNVYKYTADFSVKEEKENLLKVELKASLKKGKGESISEFCDVQIWDTQEGIMVRSKKKKRDRAK